MSTILLILGWRFFFDANEVNEPIHVHLPEGRDGVQILAGSRKLCQASRLSLLPIL